MTRPSGHRRARGVPARRSWCWRRRVAQVAQAPTAQAPSPLVVRITSPLGRTGATGAVRIVAQVTPAGQDEVTRGPVLRGRRACSARSHEGPPWGIDWTDENPFEQARDPRRSRSTAPATPRRDSVTLKPLEIVEHAEVSSVYVETSVQDKSGRFVTGMGPDGVPAERRRRARRSSTWCGPSSCRRRSRCSSTAAQSMSRRIDFVRDAAANARRLSPAEGPHHRRAVFEASRSHYRADRRSADRVRRDRGDSSRAAARRFSTRSRTRPSSSQASTDGTRSSCSPTATTSTAPSASTTRWRTCRERRRRVHGRDRRRGGHLAQGRDVPAASSPTTPAAGRSFPSREIELRPIHELVASEVTLRYVITYTPTNQKVDGTWRRIAREDRWIQS